MDFFDWKSDWPQRGSGALPPFHQNTVSVTVAIHSFDCDASQGEVWTFSCSCPFTDVLYRNSRVVFVSYHVEPLYDLISLPRVPQSLLSFAMTCFKRLRAFVLSSRFLHIPKAATFHFVPPFRIMKQIPCCFRNDDKCCDMFQLNLLSLVCTSTCFLNMRCSFQKETSRCFSSKLVLVNLSLTAHNIDFYISISALLFAMSATYTKRLYH